MDGDIFRGLMGDDLGHTVQDRRKNADRVTAFCKHLDSQGISVIFAMLSLFHESQDWNRQNIKDYFEVYIESDLEALKKRDDKGIYKRAMNGEIKNVVGVDIEFPPPKSPNMTITNSGTVEDLYKNADTIIDKIGPMLT